VTYDRDQQQEIESRYDLDRLVERREKKLETDEVSLIARHWDGQKRLEGQFLKDRPVGKWRWWDASGREIRTMTFHDGIPAELVGRPGVEGFLDASLHVEFQNTPLMVALEVLVAQGFRSRIECPDENTGAIRNRGITTTGDFQGGLEFYLALRDAGLTFEVRKFKDGTDTIVILPADEF
jgi:hypothetical protein